MSTPKHRKRSANTEVALLAHFKQPRTLDENQETYDKTYGDYTVGWICALPIEMAAAKAMLDFIHQSLPSKQDDSNTYIFGNIATHNIVIACLPGGHYGTNNTAVVASNMRRSFPSIDKQLIVGIGGGVPEIADVRLGDIVVGKDVVQYDFGKAMPHGLFKCTSTSAQPPQILMSAVSKLQADHHIEGSKVPEILSEMLKRYPSMAEYAHPKIPDQLFYSTYNHAQSDKDCEKCDISMLMNRKPRNKIDPLIHYGRIASGNQVMKDGSTRAKLATELNMVCFEMEAAGLMNNFSSLVIRGICDYSDSHKNKRWQAYSAATAAAYAKELLLAIPVQLSNANLRNTVFSIYEQQSRMNSQKHLSDLLSYEQDRDRYTTIKAAYGNTCEWWLINPCCIDWMNNERICHENTFLWINGKPGAGKSTLMKFIFNHLLREWGSTTEEAVISYFFNATGVKLERSAAGMYRSLLLQLLTKFPDLWEVFEESHIADRHNDRQILRLDTLQKLFSSAIRKLGRRRLTCLIDALDECSEDEAREIVEFFEQLQNSAPLNETKIRICFSSRHYPSINTQYGIALVLEEQPGHNQDLESYIRHKLRNDNDNVTQDIVSKVLKKASGVFMWVVLVVDMMNKELSRGRQFAIRRRLEEIPDKLGQLFEDILKRDSENLDELLLCIQWILYAKRPLTCEEFYFAVLSGLYPSPENLCEPENIDREVMELFLLSSSKGLAELSKSKEKTVQFIHESIRDFLIKDNGIRELWPEHAEKFENHGQHMLKECCYNYLKVNISNVMVSGIISAKPSSKDVKSLQQNVSKRFPFLEYSARYILHHANLSEKYLTQYDFLKHFPFKEWLNLFYFYEEDVFCDYSSQTSLIYVLAENNWAELIRTLHQSDCDIHIPGGRYGYPLFAALAHGNRGAVKALFCKDTSLEPDKFDQLQYGKSPLFRKDLTPLHWAASYGHVAFLKNIISSKELSVNSEDIQGRTPLSFAAENGHENSVILLLQTTGISVDRKDKEGRTSLSRAAGKGHIGVMNSLLLSLKVDVNMKDKYGRSPLSWAAINGHANAVKLLLEAQSLDIETKDLHGRTPLSWAAGNGHETIVRLLLSITGIEADSKDRSGRTTLSWAVAKGNVVIVQWLLANECVDANSKDKFGRTPLRLAGVMGNEAMVKLLLENGCSDEEPNVR